MHLHIAEQQREVEQCLARRRTRARYEWLLRKFQAVDENWCLVHATHIDDREEIRDDSPTSGAVVCLCPSTEANLGDGFFRLRRWLEHGGRIAIGSDSHVSINPFEELRWLEYGQRLIWPSNEISLPSRRPQHRPQPVRDAAAAWRRSCNGVEPGGRVQTGREPTPILIVLDDDSARCCSGHDEDPFVARRAGVFRVLTLPIDRVMAHGKLAGRRRSRTSKCGLAARQGIRDDHCRTELEFNRDRAGVLSVREHSPRYQQLKATDHPADFQRGVATQHDRVPLERIELVGSAGVSRMTANRALRELE